MFFVKSFIPSTVKSNTGDINENTMPKDSAKKEECERGIGMIR